VISLSFVDPPTHVSAGSHFKVTVSIANHSSETLDGSIKPQVRLSYRWEGNDGQTLRSSLWRPCRAGEHRQYVLDVRTPTQTGIMRLVPRLLIEGVRWIDEVICESAEIELVDGAALERLRQFEERWSSQNGEDGIFREVFGRIAVERRYLVEIGAGDGSESNGGMLIERFGWQALLIEGNSERAERLRRRHEQRPNVHIHEEFVQPASVVRAFELHQVPCEFDLLSIDIDGNDYWIWEALSRWRPRLVVAEYNAGKGQATDWVMPFTPDHQWDGSSNFGASLTAFHRLAGQLGYTLIGTESAGVNAFFIRSDLRAQARFPSLSPAQAYNPLRSAAAPLTLTERLRASYTRSYYVDDCGGFRTFGGDDPLAIEDLRLRTVAAFAEVRGGRRALDIGCGRGEVTAYLAARGWSIDSIDYSVNAIELTREHLERCRLSEAPVRLFECDINVFPFEDQRYDFVVASDVIEHLTSGEVDRLYRNVARSLTPDGIFVVHTFPNAWYYKYGWPRKVREAAAQGIALPSDPRTEYERLMHINEQSPKLLRRQLRDAFSSSVAWLGAPNDPFMGQVEKSPRATLRNASDIFAVAGRADVTSIPQSPVFSQTAFGPADAAAISLRIIDTLPAAAGAQRISVEICNQSAQTLSSVGRLPVNLSYRWVKDGQVVQMVEPRRTPFGPPILPGTSAARTVSIDAPPDASLQARITLVQESVAWFDHLESGPMILLSPS